MARELRRIQRDVNGAFIHVCHNFEEASDVADRIAIMNDGKIIQTGTLEEIMRAPKNEFLVRFVKFQNIFDAVSDGAMLKIGETRLVKENSHKGDIVAAIRPESIAILEDEDNEEENIFSGKVENSLLKLYFTEILVDIGLPLIIHTTSGKKYNKGDSVKVRIPPEKIVVMEKS